MVGGSKSVRGRKKRRKAMNHAARKAATALHTRRRRRALTWLSSGPMEATPAAAAAFEVPTAGEPTELAASATTDLAALDFDLSDVVSGPALHTSSKRKNSSMHACCKLRFFWKSFGNHLKEVLTGRTTCKNWLARANTCDRLAANAACIAINPNSAGCWSEQRREFDSGGLERWASFFSSSSG